VATEVVYTVVAAVQPSPAPIPAQSARVVPRGSGVVLEISYVSLRHSADSAALTGPAQVLNGDPVRVADASRLPIVVS
jgi:hypothetical protein